MNKIIYIRADANEIIGVGHIMRCLSIAERLSLLGTRVIFITADERTEHFVREKNYPTICMHTIWNQLEGELDELKTIISEQKIKILLIDNYFVTERYLSELNSITNVVYIDDIDKFIYPVSELINYNIYSDELGYLQKYQSKGFQTQFLLGTSYVPLRAEFLNMKPRQYNHIKKILITSGGTDNFNMIDNLLERLTSEGEFKESEYFCIIGRFNVNRFELTKKYNTCTNIHLLYDVHNIADYMKLCDVCITAGGSTVYELCACGLPSIIYTIADNQLNIARKFSEIGLIPWVGDIRDNMTSCLDNTISELKRYSEPVYWERVSKHMMDCVDGRGAERIAKFLSDLKETRNMED